MQTLTLALVLAVIVERLMTLLTLSLSPVVRTLLTTLVAATVCTGLGVDVVAALGVVGVTPVVGVLLTAIFVSGVAQYIHGKLGSFLHATLDEVRLDSLAQLKVYSGDAVASWENDEDDVPSDAETVVGRRR